MLYIAYSPKSFALRKRYGIIAILVSILSYIHCYLWSYLLVFDIVRLFHGKVNTIACLPCCAPQLG